MLQGSPLRSRLGRSCQFVHHPDMDRTDLKILAILQEDASLAVAEVAGRVNLSQTPCWRRIQKLEAQGVIARRVAILNPEAVGLGRAHSVEMPITEQMYAILHNHKSPRDAIHELMTRTGKSEIALGS